MASDDEELFCTDGGSFTEDEGSNGYSTEDYDESSFAEHPVDESENTTTICPSYKILDEKDILQRQQADIDQVSTVLSLPSSSSMLLLSHYRWDVEKVKDLWFENEAQIREAVGLLDVKPGTTESSSGEKICGICFEMFSIDTMKAAACGHNYCTACWRGYIACSINDGPGCLSLRCPYRSPSCRAAIDRDMVEAVSNEDDRKKYKSYLLGSYVEGQKKTKWCPSPGCQYAVEFTGVDCYDVKCKCSYFFCWGCIEESHRPVKCETVAKWAEKNRSDAENTTWLLANSKPCPKCKRFIEKNDGCMHMTCTPPCRFEFCWLCLGDWKEHGEKTGGFFACNTYEAAKLEGKYDQEETRRRNAKQSLFRYTHYFERWNENNNSMVNAMGKLRGMMENGELKKLETLLSGQMAVQLDFIIKAWQQIVECRRVLKWSYAYGYFLPEYETARKILFEDLQGQAESHLERLHDCAETQYKQWLKDEKDIDPSEFTVFREKLIHLTGTTKTQFNNLVQGFESGLDEVICETYDPGSSSVAMGDMDQGMWYCERCTSMNSMASVWCENCYEEEEEVVVEVEETPENNDVHSSEGEEDSEEYPTNETREEPADNEEGNQEREDPDEESADNVSENPEVYNGVWIK